MMIIESVQPTNSLPIEVINYIEPILKDVEISSPQLDYNDLASLLGSELEEQGVVEYYSSDLVKAIQQYIELFFQEKGTLNGKENY